jgi:hypothetical protein
MRQDRRLYRSAGIINRLDGDFVASPKILTPADLKGKNLGVQSIGGGIWATPLARRYSAMAFAFFKTSPISIFRAKASASSGAKVF